MEKQLKKRKQTKKVKLNIKKMDLKKQQKQCKIAKPIKNEEKQKKIESTNNIHNIQHTIHITAIIEFVFEGNTNKKNRI